MCGIVGAIAQRDVVPILLEGLKRLEYRGYDSAGIAVRDDQGQLQRIRSVGKVADLERRLASAPFSGRLGIAHTRWATHGMPAERNAHPHMSGERVAIVHNGIIENHAELRAELEAAGYRFTSETDTEVIAHLLAHTLEHTPDLLAAVREATARLEGAYALAVIDPQQPDRLVVARLGSPLVIGLGVGEHFIASDVFALLPVTQRFLFLEEGDIAEVRRDGVQVFDGEGRLLNKDLPMLRSQQATLGWERTFAREGYVKAEAFWQYFFDVPVGAEAPWFSVLNMINEPATTALTPAGSGTRYGLELTLDRPLWHSFFVHGGATLFRSLWTDAAGRTWPSRFDRGWGSTLTVGRERVHHKQRRTLINQIALTSLAGGGMRETPIDLAASINTGTTQWDASRPFADRLPPYFRMDLRWSRRWEKDGRSSLLALDIQNLTNRRNVAWRYYDAVQQKVVTRYQLGLIPVLTWRLEF